MGVASPALFSAVRTQGLATVAEVTKAARAGGGCGLCHPEIEEVLADARGEPVDPGLSLENQLVCRQETLARIEGSLASLVAPRLAELGARIGEIAVDGLRVRVRLEGARHADAARLVAEGLRRLVCAELEVEVVG